MEPHHLTRQDHPVLRKRITSVVNILNQWEGQTSHSLSDVKPPSSEGLSTPAAFDGLVPPQRTH